MRIKIPPFLPPVLAHRGARKNAPENTLAAFRLARDEGATWIEFDVKLTKDGVPIVMHDDTLERTTNGHGAVAKALWAEVQALDAGSWFSPTFKGERVPSLEETLKTAETLGLNVNLELKPCPNRAEETTHLVMAEAIRVWPKEKTPPLVSSFDLTCLRLARELRPSWPRGLLLEVWREDWRDLAESLNVSTINLDADILTKDRLKILQTGLWPILLYTINDPQTTKKWLDLGVAAVFSDTPRELLVCLKE